MARTIVAVYDSYYSASKAIHELGSNGFPRDLVDVFSRPRTQPVMVDEDVELNAEEQLAAWAKHERIKNEILLSAERAGIGIGAGIGSAAGITGAMLMAMGLFPLPALTHLLAISSRTDLLVPAAFTAASAAVGSFLGLMLGGALGLGIPEEEAHQYAKNVRDGDVLVTVLADYDSIDPVIQILSKHNPLEVQEKPMAWKVKARFKKQPVYPGSNKNHEHR